MNPTENTVVMRHTLPQGQLGGTCKLPTDWLTKALPSQSLSNLQSYKLPKHIRTGKYDSAKQLPVQRLIGLGSAGNRTAFLPSQRKVSCVHVEGCSDSNLCYLLHAGSVAGQELLY